MRWSKTPVEAARKLSGLRTRKCRRHARSAIARGRLCHYSQNKKPPRSDDTIKIAGKRVRPAEVESVLVAHPNVSEAAAIGVRDSIKGEALVCFCVLKKDANWSGSGRIALAAELKENVARDLGKALAPRDVIFVGGIPKTRNAKVMRPHRARRVYRRKTRRHIRVGKPGVAE